jgi:uncharacterized protein YjbI with pentapeptide repeats
MAKNKRSSRAPKASRPSTSSTALGRRFEDDVGDIYKLLGYQVRHDVSLCGKQTDLFCSRAIPGAPPVSLYVDCKANADPISADIARQFCADFTALSSSRVATCGILATKVPATRAAREAVASVPGCRVLSYPELFDELLNVSGALHAYTSEYEKQDISRYYIDLHGTQHAWDAKGKSLMDQVIFWLHSTKQNLLLILGDFGTGKTTFLKRLKYVLALDHAKGETVPIPLFLPLRNFDAIGSLEPFLEHAVRQELGITVPYRLIKQYASEGRLLLLLDGFDEMGRLIDAAVRRASFQKLLPILMAAQRAILTCRPAYFVTDSELTSIVNEAGSFVCSSPPNTLSNSARRAYGTFLSAVESAAPASAPCKVEAVQISLMPFSDGNITQYVEQYVGHNAAAGAAKHVRTRIRETYDLEDLAKRPVLLSLIVQTLPMIPIDREASPSVIYSSYTEKWMIHDYSKGEVRTLIPKEQKRRFMQELAWEMYREGVVELHYDKLRPHIFRYFDKNDIRAEFIASHIQACSFLERNQTGLFRFSHKSFLEYFVAEYLRDLLVTSDRRGVFDQPLTNEIAFFLGDMLKVDDRLHGRFHDYAIVVLRSSSGGQQKANILRILSFSREPLTNLTCRAGDLTNLDLRKLHIGMVFTECRWNHVVMESCTLRGSTLRDIESSGSRIQASDFVETHFENIRRSSGEFAGLIIQESTIARGTFAGHQELEIANCKLDQPLIQARAGRIGLHRGTCHSAFIEQADYEFKAQDVAFHRADFVLRRQDEESSRAIVDEADARWHERLSNRWTFSGCTFSHCLFEWIDFSSIDIEGSRFSRCFFLACRFPDYQTFLGLGEVADRCKYALLCFSRPGVKMELGGNLRRQAKYENCRCDRDLLSSMQRLDGVAESVGSSIGEAIVWHSDGRDAFVSTEADVSVRS